MEKETKFCCIAMDSALKEKKSAVSYYPISRSYFLDAKLSGYMEFGFKLNLKKYEYGRQSIYFCPWCGKELPTALNNTYFDVLDEEYGIYDFFDEEQVSKIPDEFKCEEWWKNRGL